MLLISQEFFDILCISPQVIPNPNKGKKFKDGDVWSLKDCTSSFIRVPCGHCPECIHSKQMALCQRVQMECLSNYLFFATLTYNEDMIPRLVCSNGVSLTYADWSDLQRTFKRLRKSNAFTRPFRYLAVSERGSERGRPHFHLCLLLPKYDSDDKDVTPFNLENLLWHELLKEWRRNIGSRRNPIYKPLLTYKRKVVHGCVMSNYDLHYVRPLVDDDGASSVAFYVTKYMLKRSDKESRLQQALHLNLDEFEYQKVWNVVKSKVDTSLGFGLNPLLENNRIISYDSKIIDYIRSCIERSTEFAKYFNPCDGKSMPLAYYYKSKGRLYNLSDALLHKLQADTGYDDGFHYDDVYYSQLIKSVRDYENQIKQVSERGDIDNIGDVFDH